MLKFYLLYHDMIQNQFDYGMRSIYLSRGIMLKLDEIGK